MKPTALFVTCLVDQFFPRVGEAAVTVLEQAGCRVDFPGEQTCCGQPLFNMGHRDHARDLARRFIEIFEPYESVVTPSGSCATMVRRSFCDLFDAEPEWQERARALGQRTFELTEFLDSAQFRPRASFEGDVAYHPSCHLLRELGVDDAPRRLLWLVRGLNLVELDDGARCCGFGGTFSVKFPGLSTAMLDDKLAAVERSGATLLTSADAGCLMHVRGALTRRGSKIRVAHVAELLGGMVGVVRVEPENFGEKADRALADPELQSAMADATGRLFERRAGAFAGLPDGDALRDRARAIKRHVIESLDGQLAKLADSVEAAGGVVHWAEDAARAREVIVGLAVERGAKLVVKSKSMTTEELGLATALDDAGIRALETDLGEYIVQIAEEAASDIILPAIHKRFDEVADLLQEKHGTPRCKDHEEITREAREILRGSFLAAEVGITGVNFAVADTGTLVIVENEGNARLSTSLPRCHIAVMGMEKVVPDLDSLSVFLRILARSATGQKMSSYVSLITGPRRHGEEDGPDELHLVVVDNGRSRLLADPRLRESLYCIRCGACLNACPVYAHAGGHAYGWVYPGPIGAVINPSLLGPERAAPLPFASTLCGACRDVCPVRIEIPQLLLEQRQNVIAASARHPRSSRAGLAAWVERAGARAFARTMSSARLYRLASRAARVLARPFVRDGRIAKAPGLAAWTRDRDFPEPAAESFRELWEKKHGG